MRFLAFAAKNRRRRDKAPLLSIKSIIEDKQVFARGVSAYARRRQLTAYPIVAALFLAALALFHVWSRDTTVKLALQVASRQRVLAEAQREHARLRLEVTALGSPARLEQMAREELAMAVPRPEQQVLVPAAPQ